jgi:outer membrane protein OmpA-like peptidoglycan-associated protein
MENENLDASKQSHWIPLSDMMTGLMCVFLLLSLICIAELQERAKIALEMTQDFQGSRTDLANEFKKNFGTSASKFGAEYIGNFDFIFPGDTFYSGSAELSNSFKKNLNEFFPKYVSEIIRDPYKKYIREIRIEGHTSPYWSGSKSNLDAYIKNMELSQARARTTLEYLLSIDSLVIKNKENFEWLKEKLTANGLSSSRPKFKENNKDINYLASQRVEFHVLLSPDPARKCELENFSKNKVKSCKEKLK